MFRVGQCLIGHVCWMIRDVPEAVGLGHSLNALGLNQLPRPQELHSTLVQFVSVYRMRFGYASTLNLGTVSGVSQVGVQLTSF